MESEQYFREITLLHRAALFGCPELLEDARRKAPRSEKISAGVKFTRPVDAGLLGMTQDDMDWMRKEQPPGGDGPALPAAEISAHTGCVPVRWEKDREDQGHQEIEEMYQCGPHFLPLVGIN